MKPFLSTFLLFLAVLFAGCSPAGTAEIPADGGPSTHGPVNVDERIETRPGDFKIASGGYDSLIAEGFKPRADLAAVRLSVPIEWNMDPFKDRNWRFQLQAWRMLNPIWGEYLKSESPELLTEIWNVVRDWGEYHVIEGRTPSYAWQDMATGIRAQHLAYFHRLRTDGLWDPSAEDDALLDALTKKHVERLFGEEGIARNNHAFFQVHGLRLLCNEANPLDACKGEEQFSASTMQRLITAQFDEDGVHTEDAPDYHSFTLRTLKGIRLALYPSLDREVTARLAKAEALMPWFTMPDGALANIGDSEGVGYPVKAKLADSCDDPDVSPCVYHKNLVASGYAMVRAQWSPDPASASMLVVTGTSHEYGHDHADELSFLMYHQGRAIFVDSGKYGYEKDEWREYFLSDVAHNTVGIEGATFAPGDTRSRGTSLTSMAHEERSYVITGLVMRGDSFIHQRSLRYTPARHQIVLDDEWSIPSGARAVSRLHLAPGLSAGIEGANVLISDEAGSAIVVISGSSENCRPEIARGQESLVKLGWFSQAYLQVSPTTSVSYVCDAVQSALSLVLDFTPVKQ